MQTGVPADQLPIHVTGGLPIQQYLQGLLDRMPHPPPDDIFSLISAAHFEDSTADSSRSTLRSNSQFDDMFDSGYKRESFVNNYMTWAARHVRVKVKISGLDRSCYVWQSFLDESRSQESEEPSTDESAAVVPPHELNISPPDLNGVNHADVPPPVAQEDRPPPDPVHGAAMFRL